MIRRLGLEMKDESSIYHWAARNDIPVFSPALTDGSLVGFTFKYVFFKFERFGVLFQGDMLFFHSYRNPGLVLDILVRKRLIRNSKSRGNEHISFVNFRATSAS